MPNPPELHCPANSGPDYWPPTLVPYDPQVVQPQHQPLLLLGPHEINVKPNPYPPTFASEVDAEAPDLLEHPELDAGSAFRHSGWAGNRRRVASAIVERDGYEARYARFVRCGSHAHVAKDPDKPLGYVVRADFCRDRFCVPCAASRGHLVASNIIEAIGETPICMITLTIRSGPGDALTGLINKLYRSFARLRREPWWLDRVPGGVALLEVKFAHAKNHWHPHLHILARTGEIDNNELSALWLRITKDSWNTDVLDNVDNQKATRYITKYVSKPGDGSVMRCEHLLAEMIDSLHHRRLCSMFGTWRTIPIFKCGVPVKWIYIGALDFIQWEARQGNKKAQSILDVLTRKATADADAQPDLPYPDT